MNLCDKYGWTEKQYEEQSPIFIEKLYDYLIIQDEQRRNQNTD